MAGSAREPETTSMMWAASAANRNTAPVIQPASGTEPGDQRDRVAQPNAQAVMVIEVWQPGTLKKVTMRINYENEGQPLTYAKDIFIHVNRNPANEK